MYFQLAFFSVFSYCDQRDDIIQLSSRCKMCLHSAKINVPDEKHLVMMELIFHHTQIQQGKSEEFDSCDRPCNLAQIRSISIFQSM